MTEYKSPKVKRKGKKFNFGEHKKTLVGGGLAVAVAIAGIIIGIIIREDEDNPEILFIWGTTGLPTIEPMQYENVKFNKPKIRKKEIAGKFE